MSKTPKKITITISCGNDAMREDVHVAELLISTGLRIKVDGLRDMYIRDVNGNTVGDLKVK